MHETQGKAKRSSCREWISNYGGAVRRGWHRAGRAGIREQGQAQQGRAWHPWPGFGITHPPTARQLPTRGQQVRPAGKGVDLHAAAQPNARRQAEVAHIAQVAAHLHPAVHPAMHSAMRRPGMLAVCRAASGFAAPCARQRAARGPAELPGTPPPQAPPSRAKQLPGSWRPPAPTTGRGMYCTRVASLNLATIVVSRPTRRVDRVSVSRAVPTTTCVSAGWHQSGRLAVVVSRRTTMLAKASVSRAVPTTTCAGDKGVSSPGHLCPPIAH